MRLGLIAGGGRFPLVLLDAARSQGHKVIVIAIKEEASEELIVAAARLDAALHWVSLGQLGKCIKLLQEGAVDRAVMAGSVKHTKIFSSGLILPDLVMLSLLRKLGARNTDGLLGAVVDVFRDHGIEVMDSTELIKPLLACPGVLTGRKPSQDETQDIEYGYRFADAIAALDIGQTVAVKDRAVVAVEAMEGTDELIRRAASLAGAGVSVIKVAKPTQDMRFDVPVVGLGTIEIMRAAGATALSIDAGKTLIIDGPEVLSAADGANIAMLARRIGDAGVERADGTAPAHQQ
jgi:DUF1009 family protein